MFRARKDKSNCQAKTQETQGGEVHDHGTKGLSVSTADSHLINNDMGDMRQVEVASQAAQQDAGGAEQQAGCPSHGGIQAHMIPHP